MPSNIARSVALSERANALAETRAAAGLTPAAMARIIEESALDYLLGEQRWDPSDVCPTCFTARASLNGACFCPSDDD